MLAAEVMSRLKINTGRYQFKLFDEDGYSIGSGFLLNYRNKYFFITCNHCLKHVQDVSKLIVPIIYPDGEVKSFNLKKEIIDEDSDLAAFEIGYVDLSDTANNNEYICNDLFENISENPIEINDFILLHGTPFSGINRVKKNENVELNLETLPYFTVVTDYSDDFITVSVEKDGIGEDGEIYQIPDFFGMSGSPAFKIDVLSEEIKWVGIFCNGSPDSGKALILDNKTILEFLENVYFES